MTTTARDLLTQAFTAQSIAASRKRMFAQRAKADGQTGQAQLLDALAAAEEINARKLLMILRGKVGTTEENLTEVHAQKAETPWSSWLEMLASNEVTDAPTVMKLVLEQLAGTADNHAELLETTTSQTDTTYHVCTICGYVAAGEVPQNCPVCTAVTKKFTQV